MRLATFALALALVGCAQKGGSPPNPDKPELALLTSLPIVFSESFGLDAPPNPLLKALEDEYAVRPVDGPEQLKPLGLLLAIQPQALTAERLVALDRWVREGGRLVLLADPQLDWESSRPLGDRFRPPYAFPDTGLLTHWGLALERQSEGAPASREVEKAGADLAGLAESPGRFVQLNPGCQLRQESFLAYCPIGRGFAVIVADADIAMSDNGKIITNIKDLVTAARRR